MAGTIKGRLLVTLSSSAAGTAADAENVAMYYRSVYDFLKVQLEPAGYVTEIANRGTTGSNVFPGGWSLWRWNTSSIRTWEWYMLVQMASGSAAGAGTTPGQIEEFSVNNTARNVGFAAAIGIQHNSGTYSFFNPWNGTTGSMGTDSKGNPVWGLSASNPALDRHLAILPRSNISGSSVAGTAGSATSWNERSDAAGLGTGGSGQHANNTLINMWADQDGLLIVGKFATSHDHGHIYVGTYKPFPHLSSAIPAPLMMYRRFYTDNSDIFDTAIADYFEEHACQATTIFPFYNTLSSSPYFLPTCGTVLSRPFLFDTITPNRQNQIALNNTTSSFYDSPPHYVFRNERPFGLLGIFDSQLLKMVPAVGGDTFRYATSNSGSSGPRRAFFPADDTAESGGSYSVYWTGSFQPNTGSGIFVNISGAFTF